MLIETLVKHWKQLFDVIIVMMIVFIIIIPLLIKLLMAIRTRFFWKPRVGDTVLTHGYKKAVGNIIYIYDIDNFRVEHISEYGTSSSSWRINQVTFLTRDKK